MDDREFVEERLAPIVGQRIWSAIAGPQGDYVLSLEVGEQVPRSMRLANPRLSFLKRSFEGEFGFLFECPWRLDGPDRVLVSYLGLIGRRDPPLSDDIRELNDRVIERVEVIGPGWDLALHLADGAVLRAFSAEVDVRRKRNNWAFWSPEGPLTVRPGGRIAEREAPSRQERMRRRLEALPDD